MVVKDSSYKQYSSILNILFGCQLEYSQDINGLFKSSLHRLIDLAILDISISSELTLSYGGIEGNSFKSYVTIFYL